MIKMNLLGKFASDSQWAKTLHHLSSDTIKVTHVEDETLIDHFYQAHYDAVLLWHDDDLASIIGHLKRNFSTPIVVLADTFDEVDLMVSLKLGADDYWGTPLSEKAFVTRLEHQLKDPQQKHSRSLQWVRLGKVKINLYQHEILKEDQKVMIPNKLYDILRFFMENPHEIISKEDLYYAVWRERYYYSESNINVSIHRLRELIEDNPKNPKYLRTIRGVGYQFFLDEGGAL